MRHTAYVSNLTPLRGSNLACASSSPSTPAEYRSSWSTFLGSVAATRSTTWRTSGANRDSSSSFVYVRGTAASVGRAGGVRRVTLTGGTLATAALTAVALTAVAFA